MKKRTDILSLKSFRRGFALAAVLLAVCLMLVMPAAAWSADNTWASDYSSLNTFTVEDADDLAQLAVLVNGGSDFSGKTVTLISDIDLDNQEWTPIGNAAHPFRGTFNGGKYNISNLNITQVDEHCGLFGYIHEGTVQYLNLSGNITNSNVPAESKPIAGGLVGQINGTGSIIDNCSIEITITLIGRSQGGGPDSGGSKPRYIGGIVGLNGETADGGNTFSSGGSITNCTVSGSVDGRRAVQGPLFGVGGVAGVNAGEIRDCVATNSFRIMDWESNLYIGGIVGLNYRGTISSSEASGFSNYPYGSTDSSINYAGGIAGGNNKSTISSCTYRIGEKGFGQINGSRGTYYLGGIVGKNFDDSSIINCNVQSDSAVYTVGDFDPDYAGFIAGANAGTICIPEVSISVTISGNTVGGIAGENSGSISVPSVTISGTISGYTVGGFVGRSSVDIRNVEVCIGDDGRIQGTSYAGGIVGENTKNLTGTSVNISADSEICGGVAGGVAGQNNGGFIYDNTVSLPSSGLVFVNSDTVGGIVGENTNYGVVSNHTITNAYIAADDTIRTIVGGIVGMNTNYGVVSNHTITNAHIAAGDIVGGIVGMNNNAYINHSTVWNSIISCRGEGARGVDYVDR